MDQHSRESGRTIEAEQKSMAAKFLGGENKVGIFSPMPVEGSKVPRGRKFETTHSPLILRTKSDGEKGQDDAEEEYFPYSITAGIEKGTKNRYVNHQAFRVTRLMQWITPRYRNIWPFDHARVRLQTNGTDDEGDYINASYIQPRGTNRHYIATQGPLPSTYTDFWSYVIKVFPHSYPVLLLTSSGLSGIRVYGYS